MRLTVGTLRNIRRVFEDKHSEGLRNLFQVRDIVKAASETIS